MYINSKCKSQLSLPKGTFFSPVWYQDILEKKKTNIFLHSDKKSAGLPFLFLVHR